MKTELVNIYRFKQSSGGDRFDLPPGSKLNDDRAYVCAMAAYLLQSLRRDHLINKKRTSSANMLDQFKIRAPQNPNSLFN